MNTTTVELPDELYVRLENQAKACGVTISQVIRQYMETAEQVRNVAAIERLRMKGLLLVPVGSTPRSHRLTYNCFRSKASRSPRQLLRNAADGSALGRTDDETFDTYYL